MTAFTAYNVIDRNDGTFGLQRNGSICVHGHFSSVAEAMAAACAANYADAAAVSDQANY